MIYFPRTIEEARQATGEIRAGGTDVQARRAVGTATGDLVDLRDLPDHAAIEEIPAEQADSSPEGASPAKPALRIGAMVRCAQLAADARIQSGYPALSRCANGPIPEVARIATVGGALLQRVRCPYFRSPEFHCLKAGGSECYALGGDHLRHVCFFTGPCIAPHPSSLGMVLLAHEVQIEVNGSELRPISELFEPGNDPTREHTLSKDEILTAVLLGPPMPGETSVYLRALEGNSDEWPLVEVMVRLVVESGSISFARVTMGAVANAPLRLQQVEEALVGKKVSGETLSAAAALAVQGAAPLPDTAYKLQLIPVIVLDALKQAVGGQA
jgi:xanthine dehydrogenase YagS FAD-binding subunit